MENMFSGNSEKRIPKNLKDCYTTDNLTKNLWTWSERIEILGKIFLWIILVVGVIFSIVFAIDFNEEEFLADKFFSSIISVMIYSFIEYCSYHVIALLIGSLASIVQHTKISANIALYNSAKAEGITEDHYENNSFPESNTSYYTNDDQYSNKTPIYKKCTYCGKISDLNSERCDCGCIAFDKVFEKNTK